MTELEYFNVSVSCRNPDDWKIHAEKQNTDDPHNTVAYLCSVWYKDKTMYGSFKHQDLAKAIEMCQTLILFVEKQVSDNILNAAPGMHVCCSSMIPEFPFINRKLILDTLSYYGTAIFRYEYSVSEINPCVVDDRLLLFDNNQSALDMRDACEMSIDGFARQISDILKRMNPSISDT